MKFRFSNFIWGIFLLLAAVFVLFNNFIGFADIGLGSIIIAVLALAFIVQCIAHFNIAPLVIPLAVLYIVFRDPLGLPVIQTWKLIAAAILAFIGLGILLPKKHGHYKYNKSCGSDEQKKVPTDSINDNNPYVSVNFGAISRSLNADYLETLRLSCNFGAMEVFFNQVELSPNGAEVDINCNFGGIQLFIPKHWQVIDRMSCTLAGVDIKSFTAPAENAPSLTLNGSVSLGGVEIKYI
jgi:hypothetical protein